MSRIGTDRVARPRASALLALIMTLALAATSCGGGSDDDAVAARSDNEPTTESPSKTPEAVATESNEDPTVELAAAAATEGTLTWYTAQVPDLVEATVAAFEKKYPEITVEALRLSSGPITTRYSEERATGIVPSDVITAAAPDFFDTALAEGWLAEEVELPAAASWPADFRRGGFFDVGIIPLSIAYNTDLVEEGQVPASWEDFLDPQWQGDIILGDPRNVPA